MQLFSSNESLEELGTGEVKFLLLPALLAYLTGKKKSPAPADRKDIVRISLIYYKNFLKRLADYGVVKVPDEWDKEDDDDEDDDESVVALPANPSLESMAVSRNDKINRYRMKKELEEREKELRQRLDKDPESVDDEIVRKYYTCLINKWSIIAREEVDSLNMEKQMLKHIGTEERRATEKIRPKKQPFKPFILTRDKAMQQVFGLGYPSVPVMTVDEFVDQKNAEGTRAFSQHKEVYENSLQNWAQDPDGKHRDDEEFERRKEELAEKGDEKELIRQREWDEFKDDHKRGEGNRMNMS